MRLAEAKDMVSSLILAGQPDIARSLLISPACHDEPAPHFIFDVQLGGLTVKDLSSTR